MFKKMRTVFHVYKLIDAEVNSRYTIKISTPLGMDCDNHSDAEAKDEIVKMILSKELDKNDIQYICNTYMNLRESIVIRNGAAMARWELK